MVKTVTVFVAGIAIAAAGCGVADETPGASGGEIERSSSALETTVNVAGFADSLHTSGTIDRTNPFFQQLGTNPRSCETCHSSLQGWTMNNATNTALLWLTQGTAPLFNLVDEGNRPDADVSTFQARLNTFGGTTAARGLTRFTRNPPAATAEFTLTAVSDPYGWSDLTHYSGFRRPTPTANETKVASILWTGAPTTTVLAQLHGILPGGVRLHEQGDPANPVSQALADAAGDFMFGVIFAQSYDFKAGSLTAAGAHGGPAYLMDQPFYVGINDVNGNDPQGHPFNPKIFDIYDAWSVYAGNYNNYSVSGARGAIYRGQEIFNNPASHCNGCHNTPNVGGHSQVKFFNIGTTTPDKCQGVLPVLTFQNKTTMETIDTCDLGRAQSTGKWADIGRFRAPPLRGLASRAPYFHDGQAATVGDVIEHYNARFGLNFSDQQKHDLKAFLLAL